MKTLILGGGLAGITLARLLSNKGHNVQVLEQESSVGGLCRSTQIDGYTFDIGGSHIIFSRDQEVLSIMKDLLKENRGERKRDTKILYKNKFVGYPFENYLFELSKEDCYLCLNEFVKSLIESGRREFKESSNFLEWINHTFGSGIADAYLIPYNEKIWNYPLDQMSAHWVEGRVPRPPVEDIIRSALGIKTEGYSHQAFFSYPAEGGIEALIRAISDPIQEKIRTGFSITGIVKTSSGWDVTDGKEHIKSDRIISTIPLQILTSCLSEIPPPVIEAVSNLRYNSIVCVGIGLEGDTLPFSWMYLPDKRSTDANRISFPSNFSRSVTPDGCSSILAEITYNAGDDIDQMTDEEIKDSVISSLDSEGILDQSRVRSTMVKRHKFAYVIYDLGWQKNIKTIREYYDSIDIPLIGRFSQFEYLNMDGVIRSVYDYVKNYS